MEMDIIPNEKKVQLENENPVIKIRHCEKATKFETIFHLF